MATIFLAILCVMSIKIDYTQQILQVTFESTNSHDRKRSINEKKKVKIGAAKVPMRDGTLLTRSMYYYCSENDLIKKKIFINY